MSPRLTISLNLSGNCLCSCLIIKHISSAEHRATTLKAISLPTQQRFESSSWEGVQDFHGSTPKKALDFGELKGKDIARSRIFVQWLIWGGTNLSLLYISLVLPRLNI